MKVGLLVATAFTLIALDSPGMLSKRQEQKDPEEVDNILEKQKGAHSPNEFGSAYFEFFKGQSSEQKRHLRLNPNPGIAVHAAWELCIEDPTTRFCSRPHRFVGFVEGKFGLEIPLYWEIWIRAYSVQRSCRRSETVGRGIATHSRRTPPRSAIARRHSAAGAGTFRGGSVTIRRVRGA